jgi:L-amino acid N-acyltransferase YncA
MDTIRFARDDDAPALAAIYAQAVKGPASFELVAPDADEMARRLARIRAHAPWLVCEREGRVVGYAYAGRHAERAAYQWSVDTTVYIDAAQHRRGVGRRLYDVLLPLLRLSGFYVAHAGITLPNAASVALHEGLGFALVGVYTQVGYKLGAWHDVGWWRLPLRMADSDPAPPRTPAELAELPEFSALTRS